MNKKYLAIAFAICISFSHAVSAGVRQPDSLTSSVEVRSPLLKATIGNIAGIAVGALIGGTIAVRFWGIDGNSDAAWGNVFIMAAGMYGGGVVGAATGTTVALRQGLSRNERVKTFALSLAPHLLPVLVSVSGFGINEQRRPSTLLNITLVSSIPLSISLPTWEYNRILKIKNESQNLP